MCQDATQVSVAGMGVTGAYLRKDKCNLLTGRKGLFEEVYSGMSSQGAGVKDSGRETGKEGREYKLAAIMDAWCSVL